jgi:hypothetical protein
MRILICIILIGLVGSFKTIRPKTGIKSLKVTDNIFINELIPSIDNTIINGLISSISIDSPLDLLARVSYLFMGKALMDATIILAFPGLNIMVNNMPITLIATILSVLFGDYIYLGLPLINIILYILYIIYRK